MIEVFYIHILLFYPTNFFWNKVITPDFKRNQSGRNLKIWILVEETDTGRGPWCTVGQKVARITFSWHPSEEHLISGSVANITTEKVLKQKKKERMFVVTAKNCKILYLTITKMTATIKKGIIYIWEVLYVFSFFRCLSFLLSLNKNVFV